MDKKINFDPYFNHIKQLLWDGKTRKLEENSIFRTLGQAKMSFIGHTHTHARAHIKPSNYESINEISLVLTPYVYQKSTKTLKKQATGK